MHGLYRQPNLPYLSVKLCPKCEELAPVDANTCPHCFYNFLDAKVVKPVIEEKKVEEVKNIEETVETKKPEIVSKPVKVVYCDRCGNKIIGSQRYCGDCGAKVVKTICASCGEIIDSNLPFCPLCGSKQNIATAETTIQAQPVVVETPVVQQESIVEIPNEVEEEIKVETANVELTEQEVPSEEDYEDEKSTTQIVNDLYGNNKADDTINMGRKRLFLVLQFILIILIAAIMVVMPILSKSGFVDTLKAIVSGSSTTEAMTLKDQIMDLIASTKSYDKVTISYVLNGENKDFYFVSFILQFIFKDKFSTLYPVISYYAVLGIYGINVFALLLTFLTSIIGMFRRTPLKGKCLGLVVLTLLVGTILLYPSKYIMYNVEGYEQCDCYFIYAFLAAFVLWILIKIVFSKENQTYKEKKYLEKNKEK